jgi:hypothetical protein
LQKAQQAVDIKNLHLQIEQKHETFSLQKVQCAVHRKNLHLQMSRNMRHYFLAWSTFSVTFLWSEASDTVEHTYDGDPLLWLPLQKSKSILNLIGKSNTVKTTTTTTTTTTFLPPAASHRSISSAERVLLQHGT